MKFAQIHGFHRFGPPVTFQPLTNFSHGSERFPTKNTLSPSLEGVVGAAAAFTNQKLAILSI